jgi:exonuclease SbcD
MDPRLYARGGLHNYMRLIHVSDTHLGIFTREYNKTDPLTGMRIRTEDFTKSFLFVMDFALKEHVDAILMCGDTFDRIDPANKVRKDVLDSLMNVTQGGVKVAIIGGNHDTPRLPGSASPTQLLDHISGVYIFHKPTSDPLILNARDGPEKVDVYPFPYLPPGRWFDYAKTKFDLKVAEGELTYSDRNTVITEAISMTLKDIGSIAESKQHSKSILMMHYMIEGSDLGHTTYLINDIVIPKGLIPFNHFNYIACGHVHKYQRVQSPTKNNMAYFSGSTERTSFNELDEDKGFILIDTEKDNEFKTEFIRVPTRPMKLIEIKATELKSDGKATKDPVSNLLKALEQIKARGAEKEAIIRILVRNATVELKAKVNLRQDVLETLLRSAFHWDIDYDMKKDEIHPSVKAGEVFLKPSQELERYVNSMNKISDSEKKRITKLGGKILEDILEKTGEQE